MKTVTYKESLLLVEQKSLVSNLLSGIFSPYVRNIISMDIKAVEATSAPGGYYIEVPS